MSSDIEYIENPSTHSKFRVIGKTEQLVVGARFWIDEAELDGPAKGACTYLGFRIRIQMREEYPQPVMFSHFIAVQFPKMDFTKEAKDYVSYSGGWMIKVPMSKIERVMTTIESNTLIGKIYDMLTECLPGVTWLSTREGFALHVFEELQQYVHVDAVVQQVMGSSKVIPFMSPLSKPLTPLDDAQSL